MKRALLLTTFLTLAAVAQAQVGQGYTPPPVSGSNGVSAFNTRTGSVTLLSSDINTALGYTPLSPSGGDASATTVQQAGGNQSRTMAAWTGDVVNIMSFSGADPTGATNSDAAFTSAISAALGRTYGALIQLPAGNFKLSAAQVVTMTSTQGIVFAGMGPGITTITQTGNADGFDIKIALYTTKNGQYVGFRDLTISYTNATPGNNAIAVTTSAVGGQQGNPLYIQNTSFIGAWAYDASIIGLPTQTYISHSTFFESSNTTAIYFSGSATVPIYGVNLILDHDVSWNGAAFLSVGPYVQGVIAEGLAVADPTNAITWTANGGAGEQFILSNSYVQGEISLAVSAWAGTASFATNQMTIQTTSSGTPAIGSVMTATGVAVGTTIVSGTGPYTLSTSPGTIATEAASSGGALSGVQINGNFLAENGTGSPVLSVVGVLQPQITNNYMYGVPTSSGVGIYFGAGTIYGILENNTFSGFEGSGGTGNAITLDTGANFNLVSLSSTINTTTAAIDNGTGNQWAQNIWGGKYTFAGIQGRNAIGAGAFDCQSVFGTAAETASGPASFVCGGNNTSDGNEDVALGYGNAAHGSQSFAAGNGTVAGSGSGTSFAWGLAASATGTYSAAFGRYTTDRARIGVFCYAGSLFAGYAQGSSQTCYGTLIGTGPSAVSSPSAFLATANGSAASTANCFNIPNSTAYALTVTLMAIDHTTPANNYTASWGGGSVAPHILSRGANAAATRLDGSASAISPDQSRSNGTVVAIAATLTADATNGCLTASLLPPTGNTDTWDAVWTVTSVEAQ